MKDVLQLEAPPTFDDRDWLKFLQACKHDIIPTGAKISVHWAWLATLSPEPLITPLAIKCLQSGCFYLLGRDKYFRPTIIMDGASLARCQREDANTVSVETFSQILIYIVRYARENMFLKGHIE